MSEAERISGARPLRASRGRLTLYHALLLGGLFAFWYAMTEPGLIPPFYFDDPTRAKFFFGQPLEVFKRIWSWFTGGSIYLHLGVTLLENRLAFASPGAAETERLLRLALSPVRWAPPGPHRRATCRERRGGRRVSGLGPVCRLSHPPVRGRVRHRHRIRRDPGPDHVRARPRFHRDAAREPASGVEAGNGGDRTPVTRRYLACAPSSAW